MKIFGTTALLLASLPAAMPTSAQDIPAPNPAATPAPARLITLPASTIVQVTPVGTISSKKMMKGATYEFVTVSDLVQNGVVVVTRGSRVTAEASWYTGKGFAGKSAKFELTFKSLQANGRVYPMGGVVREKGKGNTAVVVLGTAFISPLMLAITGHSATLDPGETVNAITAAPITVALR